jgi:Domain of unknown function (DUF4397)
MSPRNLPWIVASTLMALGCGTYVDKMGDEPASPGDDDTDDDDTGDDDTGDDDTGDDDTGDDDTGDDDTVPNDLRCGPYDVTGGEVHYVVFTGSAAGPVPPTCVHYVVPGGDSWGPHPHVRFVHGTASEPPVDVYLDGVLMPELTGVVPGGAFPDPEQASYAELVPEGVHTLDVYPAGADPATDPPLLGDFIASWAADGHYTLILTGPPGQRILVRTMDDIGPVSQGSILLDFFHSMEDVPNLDVELLPAGVTLWFGVELGDSQSPWTIGLDTIDHIELEMTPSP